MIGCVFFFMNTRTLRKTVWESTVWLGLRRTGAAILAVSFMPTGAFAQAAFTWEQIKDRFQAGNPTLKAAQASIEESRAAEITAYLRPNPAFLLTADGAQVAPNEYYRDCHTGESPGRPSLSSQIREDDFFASLGIR